MVSGARAAAIAGRLGDGELVDLLAAEALVAVLDAGQRQLVLMANLCAQRMVHRRRGAAGHAEVTKRASSTTAIIVALASANDSTACVGWAGGTAGGQRYSEQQPLCHRRLSARVQLGGELLRGGAPVKVTILARVKRPAHAASHCVLHAKLVGAAAACCRASPYE
eukprot:COSAG05_NODE_10_length_39559_cov_64.255423_2_plen_166_part_00